MKPHDIKQAQRRAHELKDPKLFENLLADLRKLSDKDTQSFFDAKLVKLDCYYMLERWQDLIEYSKEIIEKDPEEDPLAHLGLAHGLSKLGMKEEAKRALKDSLAIWPSNTETNDLLELISGSGTPEVATVPLDAKKSGKVVYVDMDDVLCDYAYAWEAKLESEPGVEYPQSVPGFFRNLRPIDGAIDAVNELRQAHEVYILTAPSTRNPASYSEKRIWIEEHFDYEFTKRLIISPNKGLLMGDYLIDDRTSGKGQESFAGELIHFGSYRYPDWTEVLEYFAELAAR